MSRILLIGYDPKTEDFSDRPPGQTEEKIEAGIEAGVEQMRDRGWQVDVSLIRFQDPPNTVGAQVARQLRSGTYDCIVIGGGVRLPKSYLVFEAIINAVHRAAPDAAIAFNSGPEDSAISAERGLTSRQNHSEQR